MIAGLEEITSGTISIGGKVVNSIAPKDRDIAMVFQNYALYPHMTVAQNMGFSLKLRRTDTAEIKRQVEAAANTLGLGELLERHPRELSGGQRQRVAMGRALVRNPSVFLFDEPLSNLDAKLRVQMRAEVKSLHRSLGASIVYVTHDQIEAMTMADKIVVLRAGRIEQVGPPLELYDRPANLFVAGFIGSPAMNVVAGVFEAGGLRTSGNALLPCLVPPEAVGQQGHLGIRPEHLVRATEGLCLDVTVVEPTGAEVQIMGNFEDTAFHCISYDRLDVQPGQTLKLTFDPGLAHMFDAGGDRIG